MASLACLMKCFTASIQKYYCLSHIVYRCPASLPTQLLKQQSCFITNNKSYSTSSDDPKASSGSGFRSSKKRSWLLVGSILAGCAATGLALRWSRGGNNTSDDILTMTVKRGVLATQKRDYKEAMEYFHKALEMAYDLHKQKNIDDQQLLIMQVNIFGFMATSATKSGDFENAEKLYKETMKKCIAAGHSPDDESVIELSVKLASLYAKMSRDEEAEAGFNYCVDIMDKAVEKAGGILEADTNTLALQGLSVQSLARFQMKKNKYSEGIELFKRSLDVAREVYGADHPQALVVLNDLASAYVIAKQYKLGIESYKEAVQRAERSGHMEDSLIAFNYNLGEANILTKDFEAAHAYCTKCMEIATKLSNPELVKTAQQCLTDVSEERSKHTAGNT